MLSIRAGGAAAKSAESIAKGLEASGHEVPIEAVGEAGDPDTGLDFIVIGGATKWPGATQETRGVLPESEIAKAEEFGRELGTKLVTL